MARVEAGFREELESREQARAADERVADEHAPLPSPGARPAAVTRAQPRALRFTRESCIGVMPRYEAVSAGRSRASRSGYRCRKRA